jgi:TonB family protein
MRYNPIYLTAFFVLMLPMLSLSIDWRTGQMQKARLSFSDVVYVLRSKKVSLSYRNKLLIDAVRERGIDFTLIEEFKRELLKNGADPELIEAIQEKSPKPQVISASKPILTTATPALPDRGTPALPPDAALYRNRGDDYLAKGEYKRAIAAYDLAIRLNPQDAVSYYNRGFAYHYNDNQDRAFEDYKTAMRLKSELALQPAMQCVLYNRLIRDNTDKIIKECTKAISSDSEFALAYYVRGNAYLDQKDPDRAIADYNKFIKLNPKSASAYINRGDAYLDKEDYDRARADYNKAIELDPSNETAKEYLLSLQAVLSNISTNKQKLSVAPNGVNPEQIISYGELNSRATRLIIPVYPPEAKKMFIQGIVTVQVTIDEEGNVISAKANSGQGLLRFSAETAARKSKFLPVIVSNQTVKATGFIVYNFSLK